MDEYKKLFRRETEAELQSWLDHKVFDFVNEQVADKDRVMRVRWVMTWNRQAKQRHASVSWHFKTQT